MEEKNVINENNNKLPKKEIKTYFMPIIKRKPIQSLFNIRLAKNLTKYLFDFFSYKEVYEIGKCNVFLMNAVIEYFEQTEPWPEKLRKLKSIYDFKIYQNEIDETLKEAKIKKRKYKYQSNNNVNYYQFNIDGDQYISIARSFKWTHKDNPSYWQEKKCSNSYEEEGMVPYLLTVCWIDTYFTFFNVKPNNYKLFINELFIKYKDFKERVTIKVTIEDKIIYERKFPSKQMYDNNNDSLKENNVLKEDFICFIKKEDFDSIKKEKQLDVNGNFQVKVLFFHADDFWKDGWLIDSGILKEITKEEMDKEIEEMNQKKEEEEIKKIIVKNVDEEYGDNIGPFGYYRYDDNI